MGGLPVGNLNSQAALSALGQRPATGYAEPREAHATVAIFDSFAPSGAAPDHGQVVEGVMRRAGLGDRDLQNFQTGGGFNETGMALFSSRDPKVLSQAIDRHAVALQRSSYHDTTANLRTILADPQSKIKTVNQSQSVSQANIVEDILAQRNLPGMESVLKEAVGVSGTASDKEFAEAVMARVARATKDPAVLAARERYLKTSAEAEGKGISHVVAAGNTGEMDATIRSWGVKPPAGFHTNILSTPHNTTVGASDHGKKAAAFTAPEGAELSANGVAVPSTVEGEHNGTSFATPLVATATARVRALNPRLTPRQAEDLLRQSATPGDARLGAGDVRPPM